MMATTKVIILSVVQKVCTWFLLADDVTVIYGILLVVSVCKQTMTLLARGIRNHPTACRHKPRLYCDFVYRHRE